MSNWGRKVRGILGLSTIGGFAGSLIGAMWSVVSGLLTFGTVVPPGNIVVGAIVWGSFGAFASGGFGLALGILGSRVSLDRLRLWHAALLGGLVGSVFPTAILVLFTGSALSLTVPLLASASALCAGLGGLLSFSLVAAAKHGGSNRSIEAKAGSASRLPGGVG